MSLAIEAFVDNVRRFCEWAESCTHDVLTARQLLLALMQGIPYLIISDARYRRPDFTRRDHGDDDWKKDRSRFSDFPFQSYREAFSPCDLDDNAPFSGDVHHDFAVIYRDLSHGLQAQDRGDGVFAVCYWRDSYFQRWGRQASSAVYAIDEYYRKT